MRRQFNPQLEWLPTHVGCNADYRKDEEYFVVSFAGHVQTPTARAVMNDLRDAAQKGHGVGLIRDVISRFGTLRGPNGEVLFEYDSSRTDRAVWKIVRGLYYLHVGSALPEESVGEIFLIDPKQPERDIAKLGWFETVRNTDPMATYGRVFDYKWLCWKDDELRGHVFAMLFWDGLIAAALFHDPRCQCPTCGSRQQAVDV